MTAAGIFLTHTDTPRIRRHFRRLVREAGPMVSWHFVLSCDPYPRPDAPFAYEDPAKVMPLRYRSMEQRGGVQGGYLDTLLIPVLRGLPAEHMWVCEYDVDFAGSWGELFARFANNDADLLTTTVMYHHEQPQWHWWPRSETPPDIPQERWVRSLDPLMRVSRRLTDAYVAAMADDRWRGHYEFTIPTAAVAAGLRVEDFGGEGSFVPPGRERSVYIGKSPAGRPPDLTFGIRPIRRRYFHERPENYKRPGLLYHPVKPNVPAWTTETKNTLGQDRPD